MNAGGLAWTLALVAACSRGGERQVSGSAGGHATPDVPHALAPPLAAAPKGTLALGEPITAPLVALADIAKSPARYENRLVGTSGRVTAVCQEMGCWMEIQDESGLAHVKMHGHAFFVPKTAAGHLARIQGKVLLGSGEECAESPPPGHAVAKVELDATGVELD